MTKKYLEKLEKHLWRGLVCEESCWITCHNILLSEIQQNCFARNLTKVLLPALKDEKSSHDVNEGKPSFQTIGIELSKQK